MSKTVAAASQTYICDGANFLGDIKVEHDLRIDGYFKGTIEVAGILILGPTGKIEGQVQARAATIAGKIIGNIKGIDKIVLESKSTLVGDLQTRELVINEGAIFQGNCSMQMDEKK
ncbi:MAG: ccmA [Fibrobacteres bacterium]|nr:ccmA [Fibrobacterota bacterium]